MQINDFNGYRKTVFSVEEVRRVLKLVKERKWPDGHFGDDECVLWEIVVEELDLHDEMWRH